MFRLQVLALALIISICLLCWSGIDYYFSRLLVESGEAAAIKWRVLLSRFFAGLLGSVYFFWRWRQEHHKWKNQRKDLRQRMENLPPRPQAADFTADNNSSDMDKKADNE